MRFIFKLILLIFFNLSFSQYSFSDNHNIYETLEIIKNDLKTLERAVYSGSIEIKSSNEQSTIGLDNNSEDVLTRHLLKLSEVESQFRELTNKFEEINFKLDKLSNRLSKIQADNQIRFQDIESAISSGVKLQHNYPQNQKQIQKLKYYLEALSHKILAQYHTKIQRHLKQHNKFNL